MKARARKALANAKQTMQEVFGRDAFSKSKFPFLTGKGGFEKKVREMRARIKRHSDSNLIKIGRLGIPITTKQMALATRDIIQTGLFRKKLLEKPRTAAMLAERLKDTKDAAYFAEIAKEAAKIAEKKKQGKVITAIAARKRDIQRIDREWATRQGKHS